MSSINQPLTVPVAVSDRRAGHRLRLLESDGAPAPPGRRSRPAELAARADYLAAPAIYAATIWWHAGPAVRPQASESGHHASQQQVRTSGQPGPSRTRRHPLVRADVMAINHEGMPTTHTGRQATAGISRGRQPTSSRPAVTDLGPLARSVATDGCSEHRPTLDGAGRCGWQALLHRRPLARTSRTEHR
jgi:hypothetical protein